MLKKTALLLALCLTALISPWAALAQTTTITASLITHDVSGDLLTTGFFQLIPVNQQGNVAAFTACGGGQVLPIVYFWPIVNGVITGGATVPDTSCATPSGVAYLVSITASNHQVLYSYGQPIRPTGSTWSFDTWSPTATYVPPPSQIGTGGSAPVGACTGPSIYYLSSSAYGCFGGTWGLIFSAAAGTVSWQGEWASGTTYTANQGVSRTISGVASSYVALNTSIGFAPESNPGHWQVLAKGTAGSAGATGSTGPAGSTGAAGAAATVAMGTVTTLSAGTPATATNTGTSSAAVIALGIPQGPAGATGATGANGATGATGPAGTPGATGLPSAPGTGQEPYSTAPGTTYTADGNLSRTAAGIQRQTIAASTIASASTIAPVSPVSYVSGSVTINVMTPPTGCTTTGADCKLMLIAAAGSNWETATGGGAGGFASISDPNAGQALLFSYDPTVQLWYPLGGTGTTPGTAGVPNWNGAAYGTSYGVAGTATTLVALDFLNNYCPIAGCTFTGPTSFGGAAGDFAGIGTASFVLGATAQVGTGATAVCATFSVCDSASGTVTLTTGTGSLAAGAILTINIPGTRSAAPNCSWNFAASSGATFIAPQAHTGNSGGSTIAYTVGVPLAASSPYTAIYVCGGI
jgi:collagen type I alpha